MKRGDNGFAVAPNVTKADLNGYHGLQVSVLVVTVSCRPSSKARFGLFQTFQTSSLVSLMKAPELYVRKEWSTTKQDQGRWQDQAPVVHSGAVTLASHYTCL